MPDASTVPPPEWVDSGAKSTGGLDLLGLRFVVQGVAAELIDGLTTVTATARYLSLRCWILRRYGLARLPDETSSFEAFAGRVETAVALGNLLVDRSTQGLVAGNLAMALPDNGDDTFEVKRLVTQLGVSIYGSASDQLGLTRARDEGARGLSLLTKERGLPLADRVEESLGATRFGRRLAADPMAARFTRDELTELGTAFSLAKVEGAERDALVEALVPAAPSPGEKARLATWALLLELADRHRKPPTKERLHELAMAADPGVPEFYGPFLDGWARFLARDMLAVVHEAALSAIVTELYRRHEAKESLTSGEVLSDLLSREDELHAALDGFPVPLDADLPALVNAIRAKCGARVGLGVVRWEGALDEERVIARARSSGAGALALLPVSWILAAERLAPKQAAGPGVRSFSRQGRDRLGLEAVIVPGLSDLLGSGATVRQAARELAHRTIEQHLAIAWARLAGDPRNDVALLASDGERWSPRRPFKGGRTSSRLRRACAWVRQLGLVDDGGCTADGGAVLARARRVLAEGATQ